MRYLSVVIIIFLTTCQTNNSWTCEGDCNNGQGIKRWTDGGYEQGFWIEGKLEGKGKRHYGQSSDFAGDLYDGFFKDDNYNGKGTYYDSSEDATYVGEWEKGIRSGYGTLTYSNNHNVKKYIGYWKEDKMDGFGRMEWRDGGCYEGEWKKGQQHGEGIYIFPDSSILKSDWHNGYCKELAIILYGESASTFKETIVEINGSNFEFRSQFVVTIANTISILKSRPNYEINWDSLCILSRKAVESSEVVIYKISGVKEYDKEISYKEDYLNYLNAELVLFQTIFEWCDLMVKNKNSKVSLVELDSIFEKAEVLKANELIFNETKMKFNNKYDL